MSSSFNPNYFNWNVPDKTFVNLYNFDYWAEDARVIKERTDVRWFWQNSTNMRVTLIEADLQTTMLMDDPFCSNTLLFSLWKAKNPGLGGGCLFGDTPSQGWPDFLSTTAYDWSNLTPVETNTLGNTAHSSCVFATHLTEGINHSLRRDRIYINDHFEPGEGLALVIRPLQTACIAFVPAGEPYYEELGNQFMASESLFESDQNPELERFGGYRINFLLRTIVKI